MLSTFITALIGLLGGIAVGIQGPLAAGMSGRIGTASASLVVHVGGMLLSGILLWARGGENIREIGSLPWYMLLSGLFGVLLYFTIAHTFPRLGAFTAVILIIVGQLIMGMIIDHFGWFGAQVRPVDGTRLLAAGLMLAASSLMVR